MLSVLHRICVSHISAISCASHFTWKNLSGGQSSWKHRNRKCEFRNMETFRIFEISYVKYLNVHFKLQKNKQYMWFLRYTKLRGRNLISCEIFYIHGKTHQFRKEYKWKFHYEIINCRINEFNIDIDSILQVDEYMLCCYSQLQMLSCVAACIDL